MSTTPGTIREVVLDTLLEVLRNANEVFEVSGQSLTTHEALVAGVFKARQGASPIIRLDS